MKSQPLVSVILPVYNTEKYIETAVQSIISQTYQNLEIVIVDDCSTDGTPAILARLAQQDPRIVLIRNSTNLKLAKSLNLGIANSHGKYLARMDADDWSFPDRISKQVNYLEDHSEVGILGGKMAVCNSDLQIIKIRSYHQTDKQIRQKIFFYSPFSHPLIMIRSSVIQQSGLYDPQYNPAEDYELYFRIGQVAQFTNLDDILLKYRLLPKSMTSGGTQKMELMTLKARSKYFSDYHASLADRIFYFLQSISVHLVPYKLKLALFNLFR